MSGELAGYERIACIRVASFGYKNNIQSFVGIAQLT